MINVTSLYYSVRTPGHDCVGLLLVKDQDDYHIVILNETCSETLKQSDDMNTEKIKEAAEKRTLEIFGELDDFQDRTDGFIEGAKWAEKTLKEKLNEFLEDTNFEMRYFDIEGFFLKGLFINDLNNMLDE